MTWDDELDQLVTRVHDALTQRVPRGAVFDFCGFRSARSPARALETTGATGSLPGVGTLSPDVHDSEGPQSAHVIDLCGISVPIRPGHHNLWPE
jgi:hypothetical protein